VVAQPQGRPEVRELATFVALRQAQVAIPRYSLSMSNPLLNEKTMTQAVTRTEGDAGWAAPTGQPAGTWAPPVSDGPVTTWHGGVMTARGTASATIMLLLLLVASAAVTWSQVDVISSTSVTGESTTTLNFPVGWVLGGFIVGLVSVVVAMFKPALSRFLAPVYAIAEGVVLGAISRAYDAQYSGIVLQAVGVTAAVFFGMLFMYRTGIIKVTNRFRRTVMGLTVGVAIFYFASMIFSIFGATPSFISGASGFGILFSVFVAGLAAINLALDFDMIDWAEKNKMPAYMEWFCALSLLVTLVWLYLEILRLLAKLRDN